MAEEFHDSDMIIAENGERNKSSLKIYTAGCMAVVVGPGMCLCLPLTLGSEYAQWLPLLYAGGSLLVTLGGAYLLNAWQRRYKGD